MVNHDLKDFITVAISASASFTGLLFVAVSLIIKDKNLTKQQYRHNHLLAEGAFTSLLNVFFLGLVALIPRFPISLVMIIFGVVGTVKTLSFFGATRSLVRHWIRLTLLLLVYFTELVLGIFVLFQGKNYYMNSTILAFLIISLFGISVMRAWQLMGLEKPL